MRAIRSKTSLRRYLAYVVVIVTTVFVVSLYAGNIVRRITYQQTISALTDAGNIILKYLTGHLPVDIDEAVKSVTPEHIRVTIIRQDGLVVGDTQADIEVLDNHSDRRELQDALFGGTGTSIRFSDSLGKNMIYVALPMVDLNGQNIVVRTSMAAQDVRSEISNIYLRLSLGAALFLLLITGLTLLWQRKMINPIDALRRAAEAYAGGDLDFYIRVKEPADLKMVADSMNEMARNLKNRITEITAQREELRTVLTSMVEGVIVLDSDLKIRELNPAALALTGSAAEETRGKSLLEAFRNTELHELAGKILSSGSIQEQDILLSGETEIHLQVHGSVLPHDSTRSSESSARLVLVLNDITRLMNLENMRRDFVANVSHELKTPITAVKGYLETLLDGALEDEKVNRKFTDAAAKQAERLNAIVEDLLSLSRLEHGSWTEDDLETCSLETIANNAIRACRIKILQKDVNAFIQCEEDLIVRVNPHLIEQAIVNLIDNAIKYSEQGSSIKILIEGRDNDAVFSIADEGIGIPAKDLPRVFERFYRVDKARSRELGGTGLGLAIVKHITMTHGGTVDAESTLGAGSKFSLLIPRIE